MAGYTKLFSSIVHSTIWRAENHVRLVWVTMLAMSDKNGLVESSVPGLADAARVELEECEDALKKLSAPDPYSRSKEFEGRRIQDADGGWELLNYVKYRGKLKSDTVREQARIRQQRFRENQKNVALRNGKVTHNADVTPVNAQSDPDPSPESDPDIKKETKKKGNGEPINQNSGKPKKRSAALPEDWEPSNNHHEKAKKLGIDVEWEAEKFRDHFLANGKKMLSWDKAFSGWLSRSYEFSNGKPASPPKSKPKPTPEEKADLKAMNDYVYK